jgi:archaellum component FlaC
MNQKQLEELEEQAFYESGLSADGCLEKLDSYAKDAIKRYGRYLLESEKENINLLKDDLRKADCEYIEVIKQLTKLEEENETLKQRLNDIKEGFEGCCYACEPVGMLNQKLEAQLKEIEEHGTEEHNAAFDLRRRLAESLVQNDQLKEVARKLYGVVLHLQQVSKHSWIVVVGSGLYSESVHAIKEYEELITVEKQ